MDKELPSKQHLNTTRLQDLDNLSNYLPSVISVLVTLSIDHSSRHFFAAQRADKTSGKEFGAVSAFSEMF